MRASGIGVEAVMNPGRVSIVGAGPGDPELLTLKGARLLAEADAIVCDEGVKACFPPGCAVFDVGKRAGGGASNPQAEINALLVRLASQGLHVVRLKGGDPTIFGRGGEEALHLAAHGIPCEVIPGVSAMNAASAAAGIPLTHRGLSGGLTVLGGHAPHLERIDWEALVRQGGTWVFYMAKATVGIIAARLLARGADPALHLALIESAGLPAQSVRVQTLAEASRLALPALGDGPGLVIVGPTVALHFDLHPARSELNVDALPVSGLSQAPG
jgi:uroporphyrin-III C-methyltransferase